MPPQRRRKKLPVCKEPLTLIGRRRRARNLIEDTGSHDVSDNIARIHELAEAYVQRGRLTEKDYEVHRKMRSKGITVPALSVEDLRCKSPLWVHLQRAKIINTFEKFEKDEQERLQYVHPQTPHPRRFINAVSEVPVPTRPLFVEAEQETPTAPTPATPNVVNSGIMLNLPQPSRSYLAPANFQSSLPPHQAISPLVALTTMPIDPALYDACTERYCDNAPVPYPETPSRRCNTQQLMREITIGNEVIRYKPGDIQPPRGQSRKTYGSNIAELARDWEQGNLELVHHDGKPIPMPFWPKIFLKSHWSYWEKMSKPFSEMKLVYHCYRSYPSDEAFWVDFSDRIQRQNGSIIVVKKRWAGIVSIARSKQRARDALCVEKAKIVYADDFAQRFSYRHGSTTREYSDPAKIAKRYRELTGEQDLWIDEIDEIDNNKTIS